MFITIDGPDGTGKTTAAHLLAQRLEPLCDVHLTQEPTGSETGRLIRRILADGGENAAMLTELFVADRAGHLRDLILPVTQAGGTVICDRYKYSTVCYQQLQGEPVERLIALNAPFPAPDIAFILTVDSADILLRRITARGLAPEVFETRQIIERTIELYSQMPLYYPDENIVFIDAGGTIDHTVDQMERAVLDHTRSSFES